MGILKKNINTPKIKNLQRPTAFRLYAILLVLFFICGWNIKNEKTFTSTLPLIPQPVSTIVLKDSFLLRSETTIITYDSTEAVNTANWLQSFLQTSFGQPVANMGNTTAASNTIQLTINKTTDNSIGDEGYKLFVRPNGISITANKPAGLFYGVQTLLQLLPAAIEAPGTTQNSPYKIPCVAITDYPRFKWRGIMLDVSRHFFTIKEIKQLLNEMARYKFNILHLHLTDDNGWRVEIKSLPQLTKIGAWRVARTGWWGTYQPAAGNENATYGGYYTQDELKELVAYAKSMSIDILPEIDIPGHSLAAIASYSNLSCTKQVYKVNPGSKFYGIDDNALCAGNDSTYAFVERVFKEVAAIFPYPYIDAGGDECFTGFWHNCAVCKKKMQDEKLDNENSLQEYFFNRVEKIATANGKKIIGWDDILTNNLAPTTAIMSWRGADRVVSATNQQRNVIMAPKDFSYLDLYQGDPIVEKPSFGMLRLKKVYRFEPVIPGADEKYIVGGQANLWSEFVPDFSHAEYMLWPRALALAEVLWSSKENQNWGDFTGRVIYHLQRLKKSGVNYATSFYDAEIKISKNKEGKIEIQLATEIDSLNIYYTFGYNNPDIHSTLYKKGTIISFPDKAAFLRVVTYSNKQPVGKLIVVPLYEIERRANEVQQQQ